MKQFSCTLKPPFIMCDVFFFFILILLRIVTRACFSPQYVPIGFWWDCPGRFNLIVNNEWQTNLSLTSGESRGGWKPAGSEAQTFFCSAKRRENWNEGAAQSLWMHKVTLVGCALFHSRQRLAQEAPYWMNDHENVHIKKAEYNPIMFHCKLVAKGRLIWTDCINAQRP